MTDGHEPDGRPSELCPAQQTALERLTALWPDHSLLILSGHSGRTTVLQAAHRADILRVHLAGLPGEYGPVEIDRLAAETAGCTGADLKRLAEDTRNLLAFDLARGAPLRPPTA